MSNWLLKRAQRLRPASALFAAFAWTFLTPTAQLAGKLHATDWADRFLSANVRGMPLAFIPLHAMNEILGGNEAEQDPAPPPQAMPQVVIVNDNVNFVVTVTSNETVVIDSVDDGLGTLVVRVTVDSVPSVTTTPAANVITMRIDGDNDDDDNTFDLSAVSTANGFTQLADGLITINGAGGNDILIGSPFGDNMFGGRGNDDLQGNAGPDKLRGQGGNDILSGGDGNDSVIGDDGDDVMSGDSGSDFMNGGSGNDNMSGGDDDDSMIGDAGDDVMSGGAGNDFMNGNSGNDNMSGGDDNDNMFGGSGNDTMSGDAGNDKLNGQAGNDVLVDDGNDILISVMSEINGA